MVQHIMDTTPTGTLMVSKGGDFLDEQGKFTVPEGFITPTLQYFNIRQIVKHIILI